MLMRCLVSDVADEDRLAGQFYELGQRWLDCLGLDFNFAGRHRIFHQLLESLFGIRAIKGAVVVKISRERTTCRSVHAAVEPAACDDNLKLPGVKLYAIGTVDAVRRSWQGAPERDRTSTRLNSSH